MPRSITVSAGRAITATSGLSGSSATSFHRYSTGSHRASTAERNCCARSDRNGRPELPEGLRNGTSRPRNQGDGGSDPPRRCDRRGRDLGPCRPAPSLDRQCRTAPRGPPGRSDIASLRRRRLQLGGRRHRRGWRPRTVDARCRRRGGRCAPPRPARHRIGGRAQLIEPRRQSTTRASLTTRSALATRRARAPRPERDQS